MKIMKLIPLKICTFDIFVWLISHLCKIYAWHDINWLDNRRAPQWVGEVLQQSYHIFKAYFCIYKPTLEITRLSLFLVCSSPWMRRLTVPNMFSRNIFMRAFVMIWWSVDESVYWTHLGLHLNRNSVIKCLIYLNIWLKFVSSRYLSV